MTEAELLAEIKKLRPHSDLFLWTLLAFGGGGVFLFLYALTEVLPWHN